MQENALTVQDAKALHRQTIGEGAAVILTGFASLFYAVTSAAAWAHGNAIFGAGLATLCGGTYLLHRYFLRSYLALRETHRRLPVFPVARLLGKPRP